MKYAIKNNKKRICDFMVTLGFDKSVNHLVQCW